MKCAKCGKDVSVLRGIDAGGREWRVCRECYVDVMAAAEQSMDRTKFALLADGETEPRRI